MATAHRRDRMTGMDTNDLVRDVAWLRHEHQRLMSERHRLVAERRRIAAEALSWARNGCDLGPVFNCRPELLQNRQTH